MEILDVRSLGALPIGKSVMRTLWALRCWKKGSVSDIVIRACVACIM